MTISTTLPAKRWLFLPLLFVAPLAVADNGYDLTFQGSGGFSSPHEDQEVYVGVYDIRAGELVAQDSGTVTLDEDPSFTVHFPGVLEEGGIYDIFYWVDANYGGGNEGECDPVDVDYQWRAPLGHIERDVTVTVPYDVSKQIPICSFFEEE